ncbi:hypothetical protein PoB_000799200, partial [Plakobranchus ocellatus]
EKLCDVTLRSERLNFDRKNSVTSRSDPSGSNVNVQWSGGPQVRMDLRRRDTPHLSKNMNYYRDGHCI